MTTHPLLSTQRAEAIRRTLLVLAAMAGLTAGIIVLSSQVVTDFLREGPIRVAGIEGNSLQALLGGGSLAATAIAVAVAWPRAHVLRLALVALALAGGIFLIHALLIPAAALVTAAVAVELSQGISRERLRQYGPRRYPILWGATGILTAGAIAGSVVLSVWLLQPLFDEGETLNEALAFSVEGIERPAADIPIPPSEADAATAAAAPSDRPEPIEGETDAALATPEMAEPISGAAPQSAVAPPPPGMADGTVVPESSPAPTTPAVLDDAVAPAPPAVLEDGAAPIPPAATPSATGTLISRGELVGVDSFHTGSGDVLLVRGPEGNVILRFENYSVRNGPDLRIYLTPDPGGNVGVEGALHLGKIKATNGFVNYDVPAGVDPSIFRAAVIYCQPFSVTFATAMLE